MTIAEQKQLQKTGWIFIIAGGIFFIAYFLFYILVVSDANGFFPFIAGKMILPAVGGAIFSWPTNIGQRYFIKATTGSAEPVGRKFHMPWTIACVGFFVLFTVLTSLG